MNDLFNKLSEKVSETTGSIVDGIEKTFSPSHIAEKFASAMEATKDKYIEYSNDLISLSPTIEKIGFRTAQIDLNMGIPPSFAFHFEKIKDISAEEREAILEEHKGNALLRPIVKMLVTADNYQDKIKLGSFRFSCIEITLGLAPGLKMVLSPKDEPEQQPLHTAPHQ